MKSRIGKMEGDGRTSKRLQESLGKHVKMLEGALKKEREKSTKAQVEATIEGKQAEGAPATAETKADPTGKCGEISVPLANEVRQHPQSLKRQRLKPTQTMLRMPKSSRIPSETSLVCIWQNASKRSRIMLSPLLPPSSRLSKRSKPFRTTSTRVRCRNSHSKRCTPSNIVQNSNQIIPVPHQHPPCPTISLLPPFGIRTLPLPSLDPSNPTRMRSLDAITLKTTSSTKLRTLLP